MERLFVEEIDPITKIPVRFQVALNGAFKEVPLLIEGRIKPDEDGYLLDYLRMWNCMEFLKDLRAEFKEKLDQMGYDTDYDHYLELYSVIVPMFPHYYHIPTGKMV